MVKDPIAAQELLLAWESVRDDRNVIVGNLNSATTAGRAPSPEFHDLIFNLLLARGMSVLEDTLKQLRSEGRFRASGWNLKTLMEASRTSVPWRDYGGVDTARDRRNRAIHDRVRLPHAECRGHLALI